jgi:hypothetical protein
VSASLASISMSENKQNSGVFKKDSHPATAYFDSDDNARNSWYIYRLGTRNRLFLRAACSRSFFACNSIYLHQEQAHVWTMAKNERWQSYIHHKHTTRVSSFQTTSPRALLLEGISEFGKECQDCLTVSVLCFLIVASVLVTEPLDPNKLVSISLYRSQRRVYFLYSMSSSSPSAYEYSSSSSSSTSSPSAS